MVLFTSVDEVKALKDKMLEEGATKAQTGHFYVQDRPQIEGESKGNKQYVKCIQFWSESSIRIARLCKREICVSK